MPGASVGQDTPGIPPASPDAQQVSAQPAAPVVTYDDLRSLQSSLDQRIAQTEQYYGSRLTAAEQAAYEAQQRAAAAEQELEELYSQVNQSGYQQASGYDAEGNPIQNPQQAPTDRRLLKRLNRTEQENMNLRQRQAWEKENAEAQALVSATMARAGKFGIDGGHPKVQQAALLSQNLRESPSQWAARIQAAAFEAIDENVERWQRAQLQVQQSRPNATSPAPVQQAHPMAPIQENAGPSAGGSNKPLHNWENLSRKEKEAVIEGMKRGKLTLADIS